MKILNPCVWLACLMAASISAQTAPQTVEVLVAANRDCTLYENSTGLLSNGGGGLFLGNNGQGLERRVLLGFDVGSVVPFGSYVVAAELHCTIQQTQDSEMRNVTVHRLTSDWGEGSNIAPGNGGAGGFAEPGDTTWMHRHWPLQPWGTAGGDIQYWPGAINQMPTSGTLRITTTTSLVDDVQGWITGRVPNYGWLLRSTDTTPGTARRIFSRESGIPSAVPQIKITYVPPGTAMRIGAGCMGSNGLEFTQTIDGAPIGGTSITVGMSGGQGNGLGVTLIGLRISPNPLHLEGDCSLFLPPAQWMSFGWRYFNSSGTVSDTYVIPADPNLAGAVWALQSLCFDGGISRGYVLSNAHLLVFR